MSKELTTIIQKYFNNNSIFGKIKIIVKYNVLRACLIKVFIAYKNVKKLFESGSEDDS